MAVFNSSTIIFSGIFLMITPFLNNTASFLPPAIPISASLASPGPLTAHPIMATLILICNSFKKCSISVTIGSILYAVLPQVGQLIRVGF